MAQEPEIGTTINIAMEDGSECRFEVVALYAVEDQNYIALLPLDGPEAESGEANIYRYYEDEDGDACLDNINSEAEYELASEGFLRWQVNEAAKAEE